MTLLSRAALLVAVVACPLSAQAVWTQLNPASAPVGRTGTGFASDTSGLIVFGGSDGTTYYDDIWRFDGTNWTDLTPGANPPGRYRHAAAYDLARSRFVVFGGGTSNQASSRLNDTWEWDGAQWNLRTPANAPTARWWHQMAYSPRNGGILLFGGQDASGRLNDTWLWDGTNWSQLGPATVPPVRERHAMATNLLTGEVLMFGGNPGGGTELGDTWLWDGTNWNLVTTATVPYGTGTRNAGMTHDLLRDRYVLFGGITAGTFQANTWEFDGQDWTDRGPSPLSPRTFPAMAYVETLDRTILFTGFGGTGVYFPDTWEYQTTTPASYRTAGAGCPGNAGTPTLTGLSSPWLGDMLDVGISGLASNASAFMLVGFSSTNWAGGSLPFSLAIIGSPGCNLLVSPNVALGVATPGGSGTWSIMIPMQTSLAGSTFFNQCLALEPSGGQLRLISSNRGDALMGAR